MNSDYRKMAVAKAGYDIYCSVVDRAEAECQMASDTKTSTPPQHVTFWSLAVHSTGLKPVGLCGPTVAYPNPCTGCHLIEIVGVSGSV
jgi:hypothetical protein